MRLKPLGHITLQAVSDAVENDNVATFIIKGRHKTGSLCRKSLPLPLFRQLQAFCTRLQIELSAQSTSLASYFQ